MKKLILFSVLSVCAIFIASCAQQPTEQESDTADWKTYQSKSLGFELKIPTDILVDKELNDQYNRLVFFKSEKVNFEVRIKDRNGVALDKFHYLDFPSSGKSTIDGKEALIFEAPKGYCDGPGCTLPFIAYTTEKENDFYNIVFSGDVKMSDTEKLILESFIFIDKTDNLTFTNESFSLKLPTPFTVNENNVVSPKNENDFPPFYFKVIENTTLNLQRDVLTKEYDKSSDWCTQTDVCRKVLDRSEEKISINGHDAIKFMKQTAGRNAGDPDGSNSTYTYAILDGNDIIEFWTSVSDLNNPEQINKDFDAIINTITFTSITKPAAKTLQQTALYQSYDTKDQNFSNIENNGEVEGLKEIARITVPCIENVIYTKCGFDIVIYAKEALHSGNQDYYFARETDDGYFGPFNNDLEKLINEAKAVTSKEDLNEPISFSMTGVSATVVKKTALFGYTAKGLEEAASECNSKHDAGYFDTLISKFSGTIKTFYNFKYLDASQGSGTFVVTLLPNKAGYTSLDQFKKDFDICAAGGDMYPKMLDYPKMLNSNWLLFATSCGSGFDDGSGRPNGCDEVKKVVEPTLKLN